MIKETVAAGRLLSLSGGLDVELKWVSLNSPLIVPRCRYNTLQVDAYLRSTIDPYSYISTRSAVVVYQSWKYNDTE